MRGTVPDLIPQSGDLIIPAASDKPDKRGNPDYTRFSKFHEGIEGMIDGVIPANIMDWYYKAPSEAPMSASAFREALDTGIGLETFLPTGVHPAAVLSVLGVLPGETDDFDTVSEPAAMGMMEMLTRLVEEVMDEVSSMAAGDVQGPSGALKIDEEPSLIREDEPEEEDGVVEEVLNYLLGKGALL